MDSQGLGPCYKAHILSYPIRKAGKKNNGFVLYIVDNKIWKEK